MITHATVGGIESWARLGTMAHAHDEVKLLWQVETGGDGCGLQLTELAMEATTTGFESWTLRRFARGGGLRLRV
jgi:hypothetical protein